MATLCSLHMSRQTILRPHIQKFYSNGAQDMRLIIHIKKLKGFVAQISHCLCGQKSNKKHCPKSYQYISVYYPRAEIRYHLNEKYSIQNGFSEFIKYASAQEKTSIPV